MLHLKFPVEAQYADDNDLASFVGIHVRPLVPHLELFWFARYGAMGAREVKFKFTTTNYAKVRKPLEDLEKNWAHGQDKCVPYDYVGDLGGNRLLPGNQAAHKAERALGIYQFLTAGARLYVDCLVPNGAGWKLEEETASGYNRETSLETVHHFFCNMTGVPTWASIIQYPNQNNRRELVSDLSSRLIREQDPSVVEILLSKIAH